MNLRKLRFCVLFGNGFLKCYSEIQGTLYGRNQRNNKIIYHKQINLNLIECLTKRAKRNCVAKIQKSFLLNKWINSDVHIKFTRGHKKRLIEIILL